MRTLLVNGQLSSFRLIITWSVTKNYLTGWDVLMSTVSVILPVYNNARELPRAISSLLHQTCTDFEVIAVDDGSVDGSGKILDRFAAEDKRIRVIHQKNSGISDAMNRAISIAKGTYLARQDADDASAPTRFARQVDYLNNHPDVAVCASWTWYIDPHLGPQYFLATPDNSKQLEKFLERGNNPWVHGSAMIRLSAFQQLDIGYRGAFAQDFDLWLRLSQYGKLSVLQSVEYYYWLSLGGTTYNTYSRGLLLIDLYRRLHNERRRFGKEITSWQREYERIATVITHEENQYLQMVKANYIQGLDSMKRNDQTSYLALMRLAAVGKGPYAEKARRHVRFGWAALFIRLFYRIRSYNTPYCYQRMLPVNTTLPEFVVASGCLE